MVIKYCNMILERLLNLFFYRILRIRQIFFGKNGLDKIFLEVGDGLDDFLGVFLVLCVYYFKIGL